MAFSSNSTLAQRSVANKRQYAERHGYGFHFYGDMHAQPGRKVGPLGSTCRARVCARVLCVY